MNLIATELFQVLALLLLGVLWVMTVDAERRGLRWSARWLRLQGLLLTGLALLARLRPVADSLWGRLGIGVVGTAILLAAALQAWLQRE